MISSESSAIPKVANPEVLPSNNQYKADQDADGQTDYLYDTSGNITKNAKDQNFTFDAENRQLTAVGSNLSMSYAYDGNDKRVKSHNAITNQTTIFVYDADGQLAAEYTINVPPPTSPTISYLTEDALGSVRVVTDSAGDIKARRDFLPFGEELFAGIGSRNTNQKYSANGDNVRKKFATYQRDAETGLDYAQSRYYSPLAGRFTSPDEFKGGPDELFDFEEDASNNPTFYADLTNPQSLNKYQYTYNNPYLYTDEDGHCPLCVPIVVVAIAILTGPDYAVAPTGNETPEQMRKYRSTHGSDALVNLIPMPGLKFLPKAVRSIAGRTVARQAEKQVVRQAEKQVVKQTEKQITTKAVKPYKRPNNATTKAQRKSVQGKSCVDCGKKATTMVADHKTPLVKEYYKTGGINKTRMRNVKSVQPQCPTCSSKQGAKMSQFSKEMKKKIKPNE